MWLLCEICWLMYNKVQKMLPRHEKYDVDINNITNYCYIIKLEPILLSHVRGNGGWVCKSLRGQHPLDFSIYFYFLFFIE